MGIKVATACTLPRRVPFCVTSSGRRIVQAVNSWSDFESRIRSALSGRYRVERELGRGGMALVYLAHDLKHDRRVALKLLRPELAISVGSERFLKEIRITARLQHPHILPLHDSGEAAGLLYYVMPYVEGESLRQRLKREDRLPLVDALQIASEVAGALGYAHAEGLVHRDIKPENILLSRGHAMVADFGIARAIAAAEEGHRTGTGIAVGTPAYMSPEQAGAATTLDGRADIYALGLVVHEMIAGQLPGEGFALAEPVPVHVRRAVTKSLSRDPAGRFPTAGSFAKALSDTGAAAWPPPLRVGLKRGLAILAGALLLTIGISWMGDISGVGSRPSGFASIGGLVVDPAGTPVQNAEVTVDGVDVHVWTSSAGEFLSPLLRVDSGDVITLRATHPEYRPFSEVRRVERVREAFSVILRRR